MDRKYRLVSETHRPAPKTQGTDTTGYTYDALGNLTRPELPKGTVIGYLLDAMNRRIGKTVNDTLVKAWLYQGQLTPVAELDGSGTVVSRFVYATGVNVPDYLVRGDSTYRIIRDHLGSVRLVVNVASGTVAQRVNYDEFGIETENTNPGWQPFGYAGGLTDSQTGLVRFGARDYDPVAGRWTAKDPIGFDGGATSLYDYSTSDPINVQDPEGLFGKSNVACLLDAGLNFAINRNPLSGLARGLLEVGGIEIEIRPFQARISGGAAFSLRLRSSAPDALSLAGIGATVAEEFNNFNEALLGGDRARALYEAELNELGPRPGGDRKKRRKAQFENGIRDIDRAKAAGRIADRLGKAFDLVGAAKEVYECATKCDRR